MTSVSGIASWGSLVQGNLAETLPSTEPTFSVNTSTPAVTGSSVASLVDLFLQNPQPANGTTDNLNTSDLFLGMIKLPVVPLDNGDDDDS